MAETVEVRNETDSPIFATACRSGISGKLYIHIGRIHGKEAIVLPHNYEVIRVRKVPF